MFKSMFNSWLWDDVIKGTLQQLLAGAVIAGALFCCWYF